MNKPTIEEYKDFKFKCIDSENVGEAFIEDEWRKWEFAKEVLKSILYRIGNPDKWLHVKLEHFYGLPYMTVQTLLNHIRDETHIGQQFIRSTLSQLRLCSDFYDIFEKTDFDRLIEKRDELREILKQGRF